ncbi:unnamed protein product [Menidia menidia]|uniref:(Atlantic silverside) hypothetical protein n=1 Tax=Menidia menidia TaxID=238744 RepID=A0A8S4AGU6_9TELE|nr:unnamed protein product [Menidia menidia]
MEVAPMKTLTASWPRALCSGRSRLLNLVIWSCFSTGSRAVCRAKRRRRSSRDICCGATVIGRPRAGFIRHPHQSS